MLVAAASLTLGFWKGLSGMVIAMLLFLAFAAGDWLIQKIRRGNPQASYPLAPFLSLGFIAAYFIQ